METKMILDCTKPAPPITFPPACRVPPDVVERVEPGRLIKALASREAMFNEPMG